MSALWLPHPDSSAPDMLPEPHLPLIPLSQDTGSAAWLSRADLGGLPLWYHFLVCKISSKGNVRRSLLSA